MTVTGAEAIARKFAKAAVVVPTVAVPSGLDKCALLVVRSAKQKAPVGETGHLRSAIAAGTATPVEAIVTSHADYSVYVEYGTGLYAENGMGRKTPWTYPTGDGFRTTSGNAAQPFMRPALDENKERFEGILGVSVMTAIETGL